MAHSDFLSWDEEDQDKALLFRREQRKVCQCGTRAEEWEADRFAYVADVRVCPGCELLSQENKNLPEDHAGAHVFLVRNRPGVKTSDGLNQEVYPRGD